MLCLFVDGKEVKVNVDPSHRLSVHKPIPVFPSTSPQPSTNVFGLPPLTVAVEKGAYRVQDGASINCFSISTYPHEGPQWENVFHLLDLSKSPVNWSWREHFGFFPAVLLSVEVDDAVAVKDSYPNKEKFPHDRIASLDALRLALAKAGVTADSEWCRALLIRFIYNGKSISHDSHQLAHFSLESAHFIRDVLRSKLVAIQAPSFDRADCPGCDVHRVLFHIRTDQKELDILQAPIDFLAGENFTFDDAYVDGKYIFDANGVDWEGQDVTISTSAMYKV